MSQSRGLMRGGDSDVSDASAESEAVVFGLAPAAPPAATDEGAWAAALVGAARAGQTGPAAGQTLTLAALLSRGLSGLGAQPEAAGDLAALRSRLSTSAASARGIGVDTASDVSDASAEQSGEEEDESQEEEWVGHEEEERTFTGILRDDDEAVSEALLDGMLPESLPLEPGLSATLLAMFEPGPNLALCSTGLLNESDWEGGSAAPPASSTRATWAPAWGMGDLVRSNAQFLGLLAVIPDLESLADEEGGRVGHNTQFGG